MSEENVELVRGVMNEFTQTQQPSELLTPDFVWDLGSWPVWTGQGEFHGPDGFMEFFAEWIDAYEEWTQEIESFVDAGDNRVVVTTVQRGRLRGSDSWVDLRAAFLYTVRDGGQGRIGQPYRGLREFRAGPRSRRAAGVANFRGWR